jgi:hypothetical protein
MVTTGVVAASAAAVVTFGVLAHDHTAAAASTSSTSGDDQGPNVGTSQNGWPFGHGSPGLVSGGGSAGRFHGRTSGS